MNNTQTRGVTMTSAIVRLTMGSNNILTDSWLQCSINQALHNMANMA